MGESVSLYVSKGSQNVEGRVPNLQGQTPTSADALLAGAGLLTGNVTVEASDTVEEGLIISQSELPGTILPQALRWIMWSAESLHRLRQRMNAITSAPLTRHAP